MDAGFFRGTTSEQDSRFTDKQKKLIKSMKFQPSLVEKIDMEKVNLDVLKPWITKRVTELLSGIEDEVLIGYIFELLESSRHPDPKKMQIDITGFLNGKNARIFMGELWSHLHSAQVNIGGIPADFLEKKKEEIRQRKKETELIQESLKKSLSVVEADSTSREYKYRPRERGRERGLATPLPFPTPITNSDLKNTPTMQDQLEIRKSMVGYMTSPASTPVGRDKPGWYGEHEKHVEIAKTSSAGVLLIGDSIIQGLARYPKIWSQYFAPLKSLNFGLGGDRTQNVLWRVENGEIPLNGQTIVIHVGTNNTDRDQPKDIANGIGSIAMMFQEAKPNAKIILTGLLPRDLTPTSHRRKQVRKVNKYLKKLCTSGHIRNFYYLKPDNDWVLADGTLNAQYYFHDYLHLVEEGDEKFAKSIYDIITKVYSGIKIDMSSDSEISDDEGYSFERVRGGEPQVESPASRPSRYRSPKKSRSRSRSTKRSRSRSRSRSRRRSRSRTPRRHSRSPNRKRYRSRRHSHSRSRSRHRSRSASRSRSPRRRTRRRSTSYSKSPRRAPTTNSNLKELTRAPSLSPPPSHGKVEKPLKPDAPPMPPPDMQHAFGIGSLLGGLQTHNAEHHRKHQHEEYEEPVKIKPADEGLMRDDAEQTTFSKSDKSQTRTYRRRNSASEGESEPQKEDVCLPPSGPAEDNAKAALTEESAGEEKSPSPVKRRSPPKRSPPRRKARSPQRKLKPQERSPSFTPSPPPTKKSPLRKRPERRDSPPRRRSRGGDGKKTGARESSTDRSVSPPPQVRKRRSMSPQERKRRQHRKPRDADVRDTKPERVEKERANRSERVQKESRARDAHEKERKLGERLREKHRQRQRQKHSPSLSESESESEKENAESRRKKMVDAAARRIAQASDSEEEEEEEEKSTVWKQRPRQGVRSKEEHANKWTVRRGNSSDESADERCKKKNVAGVAARPVKREESSDEERPPTKQLSSEQIKKLQSAEDPESEMEDASRNLVEEIKTKIKSEEYAFEEEFEETTTSRNVKSSKPNEMPVAERRRNESSSEEEEEEEKRVERSRKLADNVHSRRSKKHSNRGKDSPRRSSHASRVKDASHRSSRKRDSSESAYESSDNEGGKSRVVVKPAELPNSPSPPPVKYSKQQSPSPPPVKYSKQQSPSPPPVKYSKQQSPSPPPVKYSKQKSPSPLPVKYSKQKSRSSSPERPVEKAKYQRKQESAPEEEEEEKEQKEVKRESKRVTNAESSEEEEKVEEEEEEEEEESESSPDRERRRRKSSKKDRRHRHKKSSKRKSHKKSKKRKYYSDDEEEDEESDVERQLRERALKSMRKKARHNSSDSSS